MEYCKSGNLYEWLSKKKESLTDKDIKLMVSMIISALTYLK